MRLRFLIGVLGILVIVLLAMAIASCLIVRTPRVQRIIDCTNNPVEVEMVIKTDPPYHLVIAMPKNSSFNGDVIVSQASRVLVTIPISSTNIMPCNWLTGLNGHILTWSRTNRAERLDAFMAPGQKYSLKFRFSEMPSEGSSIWLKSMGRVYQSSP